MGWLGLLCWSPLWLPVALGYILPRIHARRARMGQQRRRLRDETIRQLERELGIGPWA